MQRKTERKPERSGQKVKPEIEKDDKAAARASQAQPADDGEPPEDMDELRNAMARRINQLIGNRKEYWRGCKEPACRRQRACFAPRIECSNAPPLPPDPDGQRAARALAEFQRALREVQARSEAE